MCKAVKDSETKQKLSRNQIIERRMTRVGWAAFIIFITLLLILSFITPKAL